MVEDPDPIQDHEEQYREVETTSYPWYIREVKKFQLGSKFKFLFILVGIGVGIYFMKEWFGWYFFGSGLG